jgi:hypothetical protein
MLPSDEIRELIKSLMDVREWLVRLDARLEELSSVKDKFESTSKVADRALALAEENARDIAELKAESTRNRNTIYATLATIVGGVVIYFLTN